MGLERLAIVFDPSVRKRKGSLDVDTDRALRGAGKETTANTRYTRVQMARKHQDNVVEGALKNRIHRLTFYAYGISCSNW